MLKHNSLQTLRATLLVACAQTFKIAALVPRFRTPSLGLSLVVPHQHVVGVIHLIFSENGEVEGTAQVGGS